MIKVKVCLTMALAVCLGLISSYCCAQNMETISYVPVKFGKYDKLVTKSHARFAVNTGGVTINALRSNSSTINLWVLEQNSGVKFGKPILVRNNVFVRPNAEVFTSIATVLGGGVMYVHQVPEPITNINASSVSAANVLLDNKEIRIDTSNSFLRLANIDIGQPGCRVGWVTVHGHELPASQADIHAQNPNVIKILGCR